jgi:fructose-1,6-bisphosphatase/sedoheptulose 1,7-bisphosphatase-like protein
MAYEPDSEAAMKTVARATALAVCAVTLVSCKNVAPDADQAAVIVDPDAASRTALQQTVNAALHTDVMLADDALTETSVLIIERKTPQSIEGSPAQGRNMEMPIQFRLVTDGTNCILVDQRDASRHLLANTSCVAE